MESHEAMTSASLKDDNYLEAANDVHLRLKPGVATLKTGSMTACAVVYERKDLSDFSL